MTTCFWQPSTKGDAMSLSDWFDYLFVYPALFSYWKATVKYLCSHISSFLGVVGLIAFTVRGKERRP